MQRLTCLGIGGVARSFEEAFAHTVRIRRLDVKSISRVPDSVEEMDVGFTFPRREALPTRIKRLHMAMSEKDVAQLDSFKSLPDLEEIEFYDSPGSVPMFNGLRALRKLQVLRLNDRHAVLTDAMMRGLGQMTQLRVLVIGDHNTTYVTDAGMAELGRLRELRELGLSSMGPVDAKRYEVLGHLSNLLRLTLVVGFEDENSLNTVLSYVASMRGLESLSLAARSLNDTQLSELAALKNLRCLDISGCAGYSDRGLATLMQSLPKLTTVHFAISPK
jgi:hypothetical protein